MTSPPQRKTGPDENPPEEQLENLMTELPGEQRGEFKEIIQSFVAIVERGQPRLDPETARIATQSIDKDNENKFKYLTQKQKDAAAQSERDDKLESTRHQSRVKMLWPILVATILIVLTSIISGIYLAASGNETLGASILTGVFGGMFGYLGGLGTAHFFQSK